MGKVFSMKGLTHNNGTWAYTRTIPRVLADHPTFRGRKNYRKQLGSRTLSEEQVFGAWRQAHTDFEHYIADLKQSNLEVIASNELVKHAQAYLSVNGLKAGMLSNDNGIEEPGKQLYRYTHTLMIEEAGIFDELFDHGAREQYEQRINPAPQAFELPVHLQVQERAWKLLTEPATSHKLQYFLSECWLVYVAKKGLDESIRATKRTKATYFNFIKLVGDQLLNEDRVNEALAQYVEAREATRENNIKNGKKASPSPASITRELNTLLAILRATIKKQRLKVVVERPDIKEDQKSVERYTFTAEEQTDLVQLVSDQTQSSYQPYKELMLLLMIQTGTHITELIRLKRDKVMLEHEIPHFILEGELKTTQRKRVLPLVYRVERIKELAAMFDDESEYFFGKDNVARTADNYSAQLNKICKRVNANSSSYSCRHSFKYHAFVKGINTQILATLGGWSGKDAGLSRQMAGYGASGLLNKDSLLTLQQAMLKINAHLIEVG